MATVRKKTKKAVSRSATKVKPAKKTSNAPKSKRLKSSINKKPSGEKLRKTSVVENTEKSRKKASAKTLQEQKKKTSKQQKTLSNRTAQPASAAKKSVARKPVSRQKAARSYSQSAVTKASAVATEVSGIEVSLPQRGSTKTKFGEIAKAGPVLPGASVNDSSHARAETATASKISDAQGPATIEQAGGPATKQLKSSGSTKAVNSSEPEESGFKLAKNSMHRQGFKTNEFVVYPAHGVGQIVSIEEQEVAGFTLELFVINFAKDKMTLRVPTAKVSGVGMRKLSDADSARKSLEILTGRPRIKRTMWSRRAQEYETKINSGDIDSIAEVVRDLYRSEAQPEQSYSERQLYEAALDRMAREIAVVQKLDESEALKVIVAQLQKGQKRGGKPENPALMSTTESNVDEAA